jgi:hypothetical protein
MIRTLLAFVKQIGLVTGLRFWGNIHFAILLGKKEIAAKSPAGDHSRTILPLKCGKKGKHSAGTCKSKREALWLAPLGGCSLRRHHC